MRIKEQETRLTLQKHDDDDDITIRITVSYFLKVEIKKNIITVFKI